MASSLKFDREAYVELLRKLIGEAKHLQVLSHSLSLEALGLAKGAGRPTDRVVAAAPPAVFAAAGGGGSTLPTLLLFSFVFFFLMPHADPCPLLALPRGGPPARLSHSGERYPRRPRELTCRFVREGKPGKEQKF